jgi:gluconolactonase
MTEQEPKIVTTDLGFPEGPVAYGDGSVVVGEIQRGLVTRVAPDGTKTLVADVGGGPNGLAVGPDGGIYVCNDGGFTWTEMGDLQLPIGPGGVTQPDDYVGGSIQRIDPVTNEVTVLYTHCEDQQLKGPNDCVFDRDGGLWFTDHGKVRAYDEDRGFVFYCKPDGSEIRRVIGGFRQPNGIGLSPDGSRLYVATTPDAHLYAWDITGPGEVAAANPFGHGGQLIGHAPIGAAFDSLAVEANGNIAVATLVSGPGITVFSPDGELVEHVRCPDPLPTNIVFGGEGGTTAWVTLSATGRLAQFDWARPGLTLNYGDAF